ncbi:T9SS type A sorting domain-containing protein [Mangrovimonas cancribranchiae]|uniref:T9SS type A sorting domain-containing protein n=1 Tax=Mangrovimonas cancribranchiae TaxID=3080055 RepID=A0AAU6P178_9FLAO
MKINLFQHKKVFNLIICLLISFVSYSQTVDLIAEIDEDAPFTNGQTFNYTLEAVAGSSIYAGLTVVLNYDPSVLQVNSISQVYNFDFQTDDISQLGIISFSGGDLGSPFLTGTITAFTVEFTVLDASQTVSITHDLEGTTRTKVSDTLGNSVLGQTNDIHIDPNGSVDLLASVNVMPPFTNGQTITYTMQAIAGGTVYAGLTTKLLYNPAVLQFVSLTPVYNFDFNFDETTVPGVIEFSGGDFSPFLTGTITVYTIDFIVLDASQTVSIIHDYSSGDKTQVVDTNGTDILDEANDIIFETLTIEDGNTSFKKNIAIYPNPVGKKLYIKNTHKNNNLIIKSVFISDLNGRVVKHFKGSFENEYEVDVSSLEASIYFVKVVSNSNQTFQHKIVKH